MNQPVQQDEPSLDASGSDLKPHASNARSRSGTMKQRAIEVIKDRILNGPLAAGDFIDDAAMAEELGFSRTPVREALLVLQTEGLVEISRGRGVRVVPISHTDMREICEILTALEVQAVALIARRSPDRSDLTPLIDACEAMKRAEASDDKESWCEADEQFHRGLLICSGNEHMKTLGLRYRDRVRRAHRFVMGFAPEHRMRSSRERHEQTVDALLSEHPEEAVQLHQEQRDSTIGEIMSSLMRSGLSAV